MKITRDTIVTFIFLHLSKQFGLPFSDFKEDQNLRKKWLWGKNDFMYLLSEVNTAQWHPQFLFPTEMTACKTIKDVIDLIWGKLNKKMGKGK